MFIKKINIISNQQVFDIHRHGWSEVLNSLSEFHNKDSECLMEGFLDNIDNNKINLLQRNKWIGFIHSPPNINYCCKFYAKTLDQIINKFIPTGIFEKCKGLYVLSEYIKNYLMCNYNKNILPEINALYHPTNLNVKQFNLEKYMILLSKNVINLGFHLRNFYSFCNLKTKKHNKKCIIANTHIYNVYSQDIIHNINKTKIKNIKNINCIFNRLNNHEYDDMLAESIGFIDFFDTSANNSVIECISRNTPLLVNKHPAVVEYLGEDYPFYFDNIEEANSKIDNIELIIQTHEYLKNKDKTFLSYDYFLNSFYNSSIYKNI
jgi:hypothetical protein